MKIENVEESSLDGGTEICVPASLFANALDITRSLILERAQASYLVVFRHWLIDNR